MQGRRIKFLISAFILVGVYSLINFSSWGVSGLKELTQGIGILDMRIGLSPRETYDHLAAMGETGRSFYKTKILPLDLLFPLAYSLFLFLCLSRLSERSRRTTLLPVAAALMDYGENSLVFLMLTHYPQEYPALAQWTSVFTILKFSFLFLSIMVLGVTLIRRNLSRN